MRLCWHRVLNLINYFTAVMFSDQPFNSIFSQKN